MTTPSHVLRVEGLAVFIGCLVAFQWLPSHTAGALGWGVFALLFFVPDVAMLGYLRSPRLGTLTYNVAHTETIPLVLLLIAFLMTDARVAGLALIWLAHIGFDRAVGYGLKYATAFGDTHLGRVGRVRGSRATE